MAAEPNEPGGIKVESISKTFNPGAIEENTALNNISVHLKPGDFTVVIGSNGAGKSTMLNALAGEILIDAGNIWIDSENVSRWPAHRRARLVSRVFQDPMLGTAAALTIEENLAIALGRGKRRSFGQSIRRKDREHFRERLSQLGLGLENRLTDRVDLLSGGQRQSLTLIMATLVEPELLLLDEHTAALDPRAAELVLKTTVETINRSKITTLMVTHNMDHAITYGNRLLMMHEGQIIFDAQGSEKSSLTVEGLIEKFHTVVSDRMLLN